MNRSHQSVRVVLLTASFLVAGIAGAENLAGVRVHQKPGAGPGGTTPGKGGARQTLAMPSDGSATYHVGATLVCSDCHATHSSESHGFGGGPVSTGAAPGGDWLPEGTPNGFLLKAPSSTELCLACHDNQTFAPDVVEADTFGVTDRSAGFFGSLGVQNFRGHTLNADPGGKPGSSELCNRCHFAGSMGTASVQCIDCHNPHGNGYYRNLWWASWPGYEPPLLASIKGGVTGAARYETANVAYPAPGGSDTWREITNMCVDCHHTFFSPSYTDNGGTYGGFSPYHRHPGTNTEWGASYPVNRPGAHTDPAYWVAGASGFAIARLPFVVEGATDFSGATAVAGSNEVFCLTCHRAHGSENPFSLRWRYGQNDQTALAGCQQCHNNVFTE